MYMGLPQETIFAQLMAVLRAAGASCPVVLGIECPLQALACPTHSQWLVMTPLEL